MRPQQDSSGQLYIEVPSIGGEFIRATVIAEPDWASPYDCIRVQVKDANGHLRQGPEIPEPVMYALMEAVRQLLVTRASQGNA